MRMSKDFGQGASGGRRAPNVNLGPPNITVYSTVVLTVVMVMIDMYRK